LYQALSNYSEQHQQQMISIIIPTFNEASNISRLITFLKQHSSNVVSEIIVVDGGSADNTITAASNAGAKAVASAKKGRAAQMNYGASIATGNILYFIHADTFPPTTFATDITQAIKQRYSLGRYRTEFATDKFLLKLNAFFTRFDLFVCCGGDQTLFIKRELFNSINGFNESMLIMEDYDIVTRARSKGRYKIIQKDVTVSARKYDKNSWLRVQKANYTIVKMYKNGAAQADMVAVYKKMLDY
jgi:rSAM/selenodomain-associated transferase 2